MNPLEILSSTPQWMSEHQIAARTLIVRPKLVPTILRKLEERELAVSKPDDEGGRVYQITAAGERQLEEVKTQKKISSFPPPVSWPPVEDCA